jgi:hypothetical protein
MTTAARLELDYILPIRWADDRDLADLTAYLVWLREHVRVVVVDGSAPDLFDRHHALWSPWITHVAAPAIPSSTNGKVIGVLTGMGHATAEKVVIADDDIRYDEEALDQVAKHLDRADLVGPQNIFAPMPWHAAWDTARSLLNRAVFADYPGTFGLRRSTFQRMGQYSAQVLFENLELMRTVRAHGGIVARPLDLYVTRRPTTARKFASQRVRQAYDDLAQPWRLALFLPVLPAAAISARFRRTLALGLVGSVAIAERGRRRAGGAKKFPWFTSAFAPAWILERSACIWLAVAQRVLFGGARYSGGRLRLAAHGNSSLRRAAALQRPFVPPRGAETGQMRAVAERLQRRAPAAAQRDRPPARVDLLSLEVGDHEGSPKDERPVGVRRDDRRPLGVFSRMSGWHNHNLPADRPG